MNYRKTLIKIVTFLGGIYFFLEFILPEKIVGVQVDAYHEQITQGVMAVSCMAIGLGVINLLSVHGKRLLCKKKGWFYSGALISGMLAMSLVLSFDWKASSENSSKVAKAYLLRDFANAIVKDKVDDRQGVPDVSIRTAALVKATKELLLDVSEDIGALEKKSTPEIAERLDINIKATRDSMQVVEDMINESATFAWDDSKYRKLSKAIGDVGGAWANSLNAVYEISLIRHLYKLLNEGVFLPLCATMFSLLGFYVASAAYRAFRIRSFESGLMMVAAVIVMLGQIPFGVWLYSELPEWRFWLLQIPSTAAFRAIDIGASIGWLIMAFRMWLSIESESFSKRK